jgi:amylovoran biosynthesis glycosyltransferase AmsD
MHITFLVHDIHFGGGGERVTTNMANHFALNGDYVTIVSLSIRKMQNVFTLDDRVIVEYLNINLETGLKLVRKIESVFAVRRYFKKVKCPTFLLGTGTYPTLLIALLPYSNHLIRIGCQHSSYTSVKHIWAILRWLFFHRLNGIVSLTEYDVQRLKKLNKNVCVIPNSISFFPDNPAELQNKIILSIGRIDFLKGYDILMEVFSRFCQVNKDWKLRIIGDGPLQESIKNIIIAKRLTERISIIPYSNKIVEEYMNASVYIMTSRSEGLPMVLLEAQTCGLPIISFNCETGPIDIINNGIDGYIIDNYDVDSMCMNLTELCIDFDKRKKFGQNARANVKKFFPDQIFPKWETFFNLLQSQKKEF